MSSLGSDSEEARAATGDWVGFCGSKRQQSTCGEGVEPAEAVGEFTTAMFSSMDRLSVGRGFQEILALGVEGGEKAGQDGASGSIGFIGARGKDLFR
jgi:hypothetical protein